MRTPLVACAVGVAVAAGPAAAGESQTRRAPVIVVIDRTPLTVQGFRFKRGERVIVKVRLRRLIATKRATAGRRSRSFLVRFPRVHSRCRTYTISAVGHRGTRLTIRDIAPPCAP